MNIKSPDKSSVFQWILRIKSISSYVWVTATVKSLHEHNTVYSNMPAHLKHFRASGRSNCVFEWPTLTDQCRQYVKSWIADGIPTRFVRYGLFVYPQNPKRFVLTYVCIYIYIYIYRVQNVFLRCPTPRLHCFLFSHWPSFRFLSFMAFIIPSIRFFFGLPRALFCFGINFNAILGSLSSAILWTWPYHVSWFCSIFYNCFL